MGMTSVAEAKLDARIRPEIAVMRSRTSYPKRPLAMAREAGPGGGDAGTARPAAHGARGAGRNAPTGDALPAWSSPAAGSRGVPAKAPAAAPVRAAAPVPAGRTAARVPGALSAGAPLAAAKRCRDVSAGPIRLTRRGRIVVGTAVAVAALTAAGLLWLLVATQARAASQAKPGRATAGHVLTRVVVRQGQTLYGIAMAEDPSADPRVIIREIVDENALASTSIQVGQVLWVPRS